MGPNIAALSGATWGPSGPFASAHILFVGTMSIDMFFRVSHIVYFSKAGHAAAHDLVSTGQFHAAAHRDMLA